MPKYIDARMIYERHKSFVADVQHNGWREALNNLPAADVRENRRGEWRWAMDDSGNVNWTCWECGFQANTDPDDDFDWRFCPMCGSRNMRSE